MQKTLLAPIAEVRRVTFAARYVQDENNLYTPVDVVRVKFIPPVTAYGRAEKRSTWYSNDEIKIMKLTAFRDVDRRRQEIQSNDKRPAHQQKAYSGDIRGLERLVYNDSNTCSRIRYASLCAVLQEQHRQRCWTYGINNPGGITHPSADDERIRQVVMSAGQSIQSQDIARRLAKLDENEADEYLKRTRWKQSVKKEAQDPPSNKNTEAFWAARQRQRQQEYVKEVLSPMMERKTLRSGETSQASSSSDDECCWCVDVVEKVGRSLILHAMLRPFLHMQRGDALHLVQD
jgi:hypothetical protein